MTAITALPSPAAEPLPQSAAREIPARPSRRHLWILLAITLLGGVLRFAYPTRPLLWGDDAYTVYRTHADYQSMLDILQYDGFTPIHYELYWLLGKFTRLQPVALRVLPALFGTLMVPAMYVLAAHLVRRRTALVVALVTACSAYLLGYSRDMKMYMMVWCFSAWSAASLLWWFRTGRRVAWLAWVASSLAMSSAHMTGMALLPFEAIFFLTRSKVHWRESILFVIGLALAAAGPAAYITQFNTWAKQEVEDFGFEVEGLQWVVEYNAGRDGPDLLRYATSAYLLSWEWPKPATEPHIPPWILTTAKATTWLLLALAATGAMPWSRKLRGLRDPHPPSPHPLIPPSLPHHSPQPWWRTLLWLTLWLTVPVYFMYCRSVTDFASPKDWLTELAAALGSPTWTGKGNTPSPAFWLTLTGLATLTAILIFLLPRFRRALVYLPPAFAAATLLVFLFRNGLPREPLQGQAWVQFLFKPLNDWAALLTDPSVLTALAILLPGLALYYCAPAWPQRLARVAQLAIVVATVYLALHLAHQAVEAKLKKEIAQFIQQNPGLKPTGNAEQDAQTLAQIKARLQAPNAPWQTIFMPRYVGFVWIPFCIAICALFMRLQRAAFRAIAVLLLVGVNLAVFSARLFAGTEPPLDQVAQDIWRQDTRNKHADPTVRTYVDDTPVAGPRQPGGGAGHPGFGTLQGQQGKYYLGLESGQWFHPSKWKTTRTASEYDIHGGARLSPSAIASDVHRSPNLTRLIVWEKFFDPTPSENDRLLPLLGDNWQKVSQRDHPVRLHWNWSDLYSYRRSEYTRK